MPLWQGIFPPLATEGGGAVWEALLLLTLNPLGASLPLQPGWGRGFLHFSLSLALQTDVKLTGTGTESTSDVAGEAKLDQFCCLTPNPVMQDSLTRDPKCRKNWMKMC